MIDIIGTMLVHGGIELASELVAPATPSRDRGPGAPAELGFVASLCADAGQGLVLGAASALGHEKTQAALAGAMADVACDAAGRVVDRAGDAFSSSVGRILPEWLRA